MNARSQLTMIPEAYPPPRIHLLPLREQPAYRVTQDADACNLAELLAAIVGGSQQIEAAEALLARFGTVGSLAQAHVNELATVRGVGEKTAVRLKAALALGKRLLGPEVDRPVITSPQDAAAILMPLLCHRDQEFLVVIPLSTRNHVLDVVEVYHGSLNSAQVRVAEVFKPAVRLNAASIILAHNHPSGSETPSPDDVSVTRAIIEAGKLLDIEVLDHVICGSSGRYVSLKQRGLGFS